MARWVRICLITGLAGVMLYAAMSQRGGATAQQCPCTQIVVQWLIGQTQGEALTGEIGLAEVFRMENVLKTSADGAYDEDGNDYGSGTANIFLYASDPDKAVKRVIALFDAGKLHPGMRIGVAKYSNPERTEWTYTPAYPAGLDNFDIAYKQ